METAKSRTITIGIIGAGMIGKERLQAILQLQQKKMPCVCIGIFDQEEKKSAELANQYQIPLHRSLTDLINAKPDWIIICVPHDQAVHLAEIILPHHIKLLIEKPLGRSVKEAKQLLLQTKSDQQLWVGFNYRFYAGIQRAIQDTKRGVFGDIISITMQLGHGGRPGDEHSWKLNKEHAGGGCLLDPGIHLLDLVHCFSNETPEVISCTSWNGFWKTGIEEEAHVLIQCGRTLFNLTMSLVRWRSTFKIEINGTNAYGLISGRNRSYGKQTYLRGKRWGWQHANSQAASEELIVESDGHDVFSNELEQLLFKTNKTAIPPCSGKEALKATKLWEQCLEKRSSLIAI